MSNNILSTSPKKTQPYAGPEPDASPFLTVTAAARWLGLARATVQRAIELGQLPVVQLGHRKMIPRKAVEQLIDGDVHEGMNEDGQ